MVKDTGIWGIHHTFFGLDGLENDFGVRFVYVFRSLMSSIHV